jgi:hypothetical protein
MTVFADKGEEGMRGRGRGRVGSGSGSGGSDNDGIEDGRSSGGIEGAGRGVQGVTVKTDITVHVDEDGASTTKLVRSRYS